MGKSSTICIEKNRHLQATTLCQNS